MAVAQPERADVATPGEVGQGAAARPRVLYVCADVVGEQMAGLGVSQLGARSSPARLRGRDDRPRGTEDQTEPGFRTMPYWPHARHDLAALIAGAAVVVAHPSGRSSRGG